MKRFVVVLLTLVAASGLAGPNLGDYNAGDTVCGYFNTFQPSTGASFTLASGTLAAYKDNSATQDTDGLTLDNDFDSVTGYHQACVDTSADGTFYSAGSRISIMLSAGTVDSVSVAGAEVFSFSILDGTQATINAQFPTDFDTLTIANAAVNANAKYWDDVEITTPLQDVDDVADAVRSEPCGSETADTIGARICDDVEDTKTAVESTLPSMLSLVSGMFLNCEVNTANFAGDADEFACILTDVNGDPVTQASGDLEGLLIVVTSGDQIAEQRYINDTTWDGANSELQLQLSRPLPGTLADSVGVVIK